MKVALLEALLEARHGKRPVVLVTDLGSGVQRLAEADDADEAVGKALRSDRCQTVGETFYLPFSPPLRLVVVGAVHVTQELVPLARRLGYAVVVVDPRPAFARAERFEGVEVHAEWPDEVLPTLGLDRRTAVVTFTHDPKIDDPALIAALKSDAFYVGALGSRKTHAARRARLLEEGFGDPVLDRIHGPIGLPLGGRSPAEIALSTMAQITQVLRRGEA